VSASAFTEDIYRKIFRPRTPKKSLLTYSRLCVLCIAILACLLALQEGIIYLLIAFAWGGLAASFGPVVILTLWWKNITKIGVIAGMISGCVSVIAWEILGLAEYIHPGIFIPSVLPGFITSFLLVIIVSRVTHQK
jgi:Na+/proline symporter